MGESLKAGLVAFYMCSEHGQYHLTFSISHILRVLCTYVESQHLSVGLCSSIYTNNYTMNI